MHAYDNVDAGVRDGERRKTRHALIDALAAKRVRLDLLIAVLEDLRTNDAELELRMTEVEAHVRELARTVGEIQGLGIELEALR